MLNSNTSSNFLSLRWRLLIVFTLLFLAVLLGLFFWFRDFATKNALNSLENDLRATAQAAASGIDGDEHTQLWQTGTIDDATYLKINTYLREVKRTNPKSSGIYTYVKDPQNPNQALFVVSAAVPPGITLSERERQLQATQLSGCQIKPENRPLLNAAFTVADGYSTPMTVGFSQPTIDPVPWKDQWGEWITGAAPIYNSKGESVGAVGVDMCMAEVRAVTDRINKTLLPIFGALIMVCGVGVYLLAYRLTRPILKLTHVANKIGQGDYTTAVPVGNGNLRDEVDSLSDVFAMMVEKVREREQNLKQQVAELQIMVDETKRKEQVSEIVDSEFFQTLQEKAREARARRIRPAE